MPGKRRTTMIADWALPIALLTGMTAVFWLTDIDVSLSSRYFVSGEGWTQGDDQPWHFLYHYGVVPAWIVALSALALLIASLRAGRFASSRRRCIFLVAVMIVGPGLLVNTLFKQNWGRPRPRDLVEFSGDREYVQVLAKRPSAMGNSFASGHAATGFYLFAPFFFLRRRSRWWSLFFLALGLGYGSIIGLARIIQGAHFLSDVVWAGGLVYLSGLFFFYLLRPDREMAG